MKSLLFAVLLAALSFVSPVKAETKDTCVEGEYCSVVYDQPAIVLGYSVVYANTPLAVRIGYPQERDRIGATDEFEVVTVVQRELGWIRYTTASGDSYWTNFQNIKTSPPEGTITPRNSQPIAAYHYRDETPCN